MTNSFYTIKVAEAHQQERLEAARIAQLLREARAHQPSLKQRAGNSLGQFLIKMGERLQTKPQEIYPG